MHAVFGRLRPDRFPDEPERRRVKVQQVHRALGWIKLGDPEPLGLDSRQPAAGLPYPARDPLSQLHVAALEVDVVGDQERPRAHGHRPGPRMQNRWTEVRLPARLTDMRLEALVLPAADV